MNKNRDDALNNLVAEYENISKQGLAVFLDEKAYQQLIDYYESEGLPEKALEVAGRAIQHYSFSVDFYLRQANLLIETHREHEALNVLEHAANFSPGELEIELLRAEAFIYLDQTDTALAILDACKAGAEGHDLSDILLVEAVLFEQEEAYERMFISLRAALDLWPENEEALEKMWLATELSKQYEESVRFHETLLEDYPYAYLAWYNLAHAHACLGNYDEAIEAYEFAFSINDQFEFAYRDCAELCFELQQYGKALRLYLEMQEQFDPEGETLLRIGQCFQHLGKYEEAKEYFVKAIHIDPMDDEAHFCLGQCWAEKGNWKSAIRCYQKAIHIEDGREEYYLGMAEALEQTGDLTGAAFYFKASLEIAPEEKDLWLRYITFLLDTGQFEEALKCSEEAITFDLGAELIYSQAACLLRLGRRQEALYWLGEALLEDYEAHGVLFSLVPALTVDPDVANLIAAR
ncbi:MAG: tetratricopeptide repeat protein [Lewinellaceae bacterium]|nr:tetratricopeptide repeat protein [Lewinella sp.]MCB9282026.1 tetratricopeptide repeat protein [Lewinellaceae bacterium]